MASGSQDNPISPNAHSHIRTVQIIRGDGIPEDPIDNVLCLTTYNILIGTRKFWDNANTLGISAFYSDETVKVFTGPGK